MPANNTKVFELEEKHPGRLGMIFSPGGWKHPRSLPYGLDNGRYPVWASGKEWDEVAWRKLIESAVAHKERPPLWVAIPDVVGDAVATFREWDRWWFEVPFEWPHALVVQDGMTPDSVKTTCNPQPEVIFVGGTTQWKWRTVWSWCRAFPRVHVGRVNEEKWLWNAHKCGAESTDGSGWFRGDKRQLRGLLRYLNLSDKGMDTGQLELEYARYG